MKTVPALGITEWNTVQFPRYHLCMPLKPCLKFYGIWSKGREDTEENLNLCDNVRLELIGFLNSANLTHHVTFCLSLCRGGDTIGCMSQRDDL